MNENLLQIKESVKVIDSEKQYWLVRTMSGVYYSEYSTRNFIAIGFNGLKRDYIKEVIRVGEENAQKILAEKLDLIYEGKLDDSGKKVNGGYAAAQIIKFFKNMKVGDIVIIPSSESRKIKVGVIESEVYTGENISKDKSACPFQKRRKVRWSGEFYRTYLSPRLQLMFNSRHIVSNVDSYSNYIDSLVNNFYIKDEKTHLLLRVKTEEDISAASFSAVFDIFNLMDDFLEDQGENHSSEDIDMKISVESPGFISLVAADPSLILFFGLFILLLNGGHLNIERLGLRIGTDGLIHTISNYLDRRRDRISRKKIVERLESLNIENPEDLIKLIKETQNPRDSY